MRPYVLLVAFLLGAYAPGAQVLAHRLDGTEVTQLAPANAPAVVLFFVASDCPISNRMIPTMKALRERYTAPGVRFWYVYPNTTESAASAKRHLLAFDPGGEALLDPDNHLAGLAGAVATPEVAILVRGGDSAWHPVYTGRIDDRFVSLGQERPQPTQHFAETALGQVLRHQPVAPATGVPVGCAIVGPVSGRAR